MGKKKEEKREKEEAKKAKKAAETAVKATATPDEEAPKQKKTVKKSAAKEKPAPKKKKRSKTITDGDIAIRAYLIAESRSRTGQPGTPHGDWLEAERQLRAEAGLA